MELKEVLFQLRKEKELSQAELAEKLGVTRQAVSRWEAGLAAPSVESLIGLSRVYGMTVDEMLQRCSSQTGTAGPDESAETGSSAEPGGREDAAAGAQAEKTRRRPRKWLWCLIFAVVYSGAILLWGRLTNSPSMAAIYLIWSVIFAALGCLLYGVYVVITYFKKK